MARIDVPAGPGGEAAMVWRLQPEMGAMVETMVRTVYGSSILPAEEREVARMAIARLNECNACATFRAPSVRAARVDEELYSHLDEYQVYDGYSRRQRLAIEYAGRFATDHGGIDDELFARLRAAFSAAEVLDLTMCIATYLGLGRALAVLGIEEHAPLEL
ncbi:MAG: carboxymuconolactone decarboxylase family protein [Acidobacteriota bacterium]|nr:carboxymuconolactone decarboxylase family protein [Acidobacteriota bacterium]